MCFAPKLVSINSDASSHSCDPVSQRAACSLSPRAWSINSGHYLAITNVTVSQQASWSSTINKWPFTLSTVSGPPSFAFLLLRPELSQVVDKAVTPLLATGKMIGPIPHASVKSFSHPVSYTHVSHGLSLPYSSSHDFIISFSLSIPLVHNAVLDFLPHPSWLPLVSLIHFPAFANGLRSPIVVLCSLNPPDLGICTLIRSCYFVIYGLSSDSRLVLTISESRSQKRTHLMEL